MRTDTTNHTPFFLLASCKLGIESNTLFIRSITVGNRKINFNWITYFKVRNYVLISNTNYPRKLTQVRDGFVALLFCASAAKYRLCREYHSSARKKAHDWRSSCRRANNQSLVVVVSGRPWPRLCLPTRGDIQIGRSCEPRMRTRNLFIFYNQHCYWINLFLNQWYIYLYEEHGHEGATLFQMECTH